MSYPLTHKLIIVSTLSVYEILGNWPGGNCSQF